MIIPRCSCLPNLNFWKLCVFIPTSGYLSQWVDKFNQMSDPTLQSFSPSLNQPVASWEIIPFCYQPIKCRHNSCFTSCSPSSVIVTHWAPILLCVYELVPCRCDLFSHVTCLYIAIGDIAILCNILAAGLERPRLMALISYSNLRLHQHFLSNSISDDYPLCIKWLVIICKMWGKTNEGIKLHFAAMGIGS